MTEKWLSRRATRILAKIRINREHSPHAKSQADQRHPDGPRMGPRLRRPHPRRTKTDRQNAVGPQRARDASAAREGSGAAESADEGGESAGWRDEKNREPGRVPLDEHDQKGAGAEASQPGRAQVDACEAASQEDLEEE